MAKNKNNVFLITSWLFEFGKIILIISVILILINFFVATIFAVSGESMETNFHDQEILMVDRLTYKFKNPQRGDVVIFRYPGAPSEKYIKRIIGLPGEEISIKNSKVLIKNKKENSEFILEEQYLSQDINFGTNITENLSDDEYFVMGDNRENSSDSRVWGTLPKEFIIGKAFIVIYPLNYWHIMKSK